MRVLTVCDLGFYRKTPGIYLVTLFFVYLHCLHLCIIMKDRLIKFMKTEGVSAAKLAETIQVQPSTISHIMAGRNNPRYDFLAAVMRHYPKLSARWLMLGEGEMYDNLSRSTPDNTPEESHNKLNNNELTASQEVLVYTEKIVILNSDGTFKLYNTPCV